MRVLIAGSSGLIGTALCRALGAAGHEVVRLVRRKPAGEDTIFWDPEAGVLDVGALARVEAVVHLGGRSIAGARWTAKVKRDLRHSRVQSTRFLAGALAAFPAPPRVFICASAIGIYGDRGDEELHEESGAGAGFLAELGQEWEGAGAAAVDAGIRVVQARFGIVLSSQGGALAKMLPPFRLGVGGRLGNGKQYFSWVALEDSVAALMFALDKGDLHGPVNITAPAPVNNAELTRALGRVLRRPTVFPLPAFAAKILLGELAEEGLLASQRVVPQRLLDNGFQFAYPEIDGALRRALEV